MLFEEREREQKEELFRDYIGQALWHITSIQHLKTTEPNKMPQYIELSHPERRVEAEPMTAEEIKEHILQKLGC